jgi:uncharacterized protein YhjY with autotransporter beta-barrel domain
LAIAVGLISASASARADEPPAAVFAFGDSLLDLQRVCPLQYPTNPNGACGNGKGLLQILPNYANFTADLSNNLAAGGAGTGATNVASLAFGSRATGTGTQIGSFVVSGRRIGSRDLTLISGRNNFLLFFLNPALNGGALATRALSEVNQEITGVVGAGARNIIYFDSRSPISPPLPQVNVYESQFSAGLRPTLAAFARPGVRLRILDLNGLTAAVVANPTRYGFSTSLSCTADPGCLTASAAVQNGHFIFDQHPTEAGYTLLARYIANLEASADGMASQNRVVAGAADGVSGAIIDRAASDAISGRRGVFVDGGYARDRQRDFYGDGGTALGFRSDTGSVIGGFSADVSGDALIGAAVAYARTNATLFDGGGTIKADTYQAGLFASWRRSAIFIEGTAGYAYHKLAARRPGIDVDLVAKPDARSLVASARAGVLPQFGAVRLGPVVALDYDRTRVGGYREFGDDLVAQQVDSTRFDTVLARGGGRLELAPSAPGGLTGFIEATAVRNLDRNGLVIQTANVYALGLPIYTQIDPDWNDRWFGNVNGALSGSIARNVQLRLRGSATAFRRGSNAYSIEGGLSLAL